MRPVYLRTAGGAASSPVCPMDLYISPFSVTLQAKVQGTVVYDVQYTKDNVWSSSFDPATAQWTTLSGMSSATASAEATLTSPVSAIRLVQNSGSGSVELIVLQAGLR